MGKKSKNDYEQEHDDFPISCDFRENHDDGLYKFPEE